MSQTLGENSRAKIAGYDTDRKEFMPGNPQSSHTA